MRMNLPTQHTGHSLRSEEFPPRFGEVCAGRFICVWNHDLHAIYDFLWRSKFWIVLSKPDWGISEALLLLCAIP
eukprot:12033136-Karenia_brevis.AAC.1